MKKIYLLSIISMLTFVSACKKEISQPQTPVDKPSTETDQPNKIRLMTDGSGGSTATIVYDAASGKYKANFGGAELEFSPVPNNTNYSDNDIAVTGITCTNCQGGVISNGSYFTAIVPTMPAVDVNHLNAQLDTFYRKFNDFVTRKKNADSTYKEFTLPNFPAVSGSYSAVVSGVVVRSHSSPSTCIIKPSTFMPNIPGTTNIISMEIGGISQVDPATGHTIYYDIFIDQATKRIIQVLATDQTTQQSLSNVTWSGTCTVTGTGINQAYFVTLKIMVGDAIVVDRTNHQIVE